jgi:hypothetical protein
MRQVFNHCATTAGQRILYALNDNKKHLSFADAKFIAFFMDLILKGK